MSRGLGDVYKRQQNELGNAEPYFAAVSPVLDLTVIRPDDAPHILPCFDEADEGIGISEDEPLGFRYNPKQVIKLMGKRYLVGPVIFHRFDDDGNFASLTMSDMYAIQKYLEDEMAEMIIRASVGEGDTIVVDFDKDKQEIVTNVKKSESAAEA